MHQGIYFCGRFEGMQYCHGAAKAWWIDMLLHHITCVFAKTAFQVPSTTHKTWTSVCPMGLGNWYVNVLCHGYSKNIISIYEHVWLKAVSIPSWYIQYVVKPRMYCSLWTSHSAQLLNSYATNVVCYCFLCGCNIHCLYAMSYLLYRITCLPGTSPASSQWHANHGMDIGQRL